MFRKYVITVLVPCQDKRDISEAEVLSDEVIEPALAAAKKHEWEIQSSFAGFTE